jgi:glutamyl-tRNA synthetase
VLRREKRPEEVVGELAHLCGLTERSEPVAARELIPHFDWEKIKREDIAL